MSYSKKLANLTQSSDNKKYFFLYYRALYYKDNVDCFSVDVKDILSVTFLCHIIHNFLHIVHNKINKDYLKMKSLNFLITNHTSVTLCSIGHLSGRIMHHLL